MKTETVRPKNQGLPRHKVYVFTGLTQESQYRQTIYAKTNYDANERFD
jgi:hypothetical protein